MLTSFPCLGNYLTDLNSKDKYLIWGKIDLRNWWFMQFIHREKGGKRSFFLHLSFGHQIKSSKVLVEKCTETCPTEKFEIEF